MKEKLVNVALLLGSVILAVVALEIGLRAYHGEWEYVNYRFPIQNKLVNHTYDPELGWLPASSNQWGTSITILKEGVRSNGRGEVWEGTDDPIVAFGDSYAFGEKVADSETWPAQLEKLSGKRVINAGVDGYGVDQIFLRARRLLSRYRFSTVIFSFIPDDIRRSQMSVNYGRAKSYFDLKNGQLTLENVPVPPPAPLPKESGPVIALEHSLLVDTVMKRLFPKWWLRLLWETQVQDPEKATRLLAPCFTSSKCSRNRAAPN